MSEPTLEMIERGSPRRGSILFVHGAYHGAWCWENFLPTFAEAGFQARALSFRGHGKSEGHEQIRNFRLADYARDVETAAQGLPAPVFVIAHSMGSAVTLKWMESFKPRLSGVVLLGPSAALRGPHSGKAFVAIARHHFLAGLELLFLGSTRAIVKTPGRTRRALYTPRTPESIVRSTFERCGQESNVALRWEVNSRRFISPGFRPSCPLLIVEAQKDTLVYAGDLEDMKKAWGSDLLSIAESGHNLMLDTPWPECAREILRWLDAHGARL